MLRYVRENIRKLKIRILNFLDIRMKTLPMYEAQNFVLFEMARNKEELMRKEIMDLIKICQVGTDIDVILHVFPLQERKISYRIE